MWKFILTISIFTLLVLQMSLFPNPVPYLEIDVADDGNPSGTPGDDDFVFSKPFSFEEYAYGAGFSSTNPVTISYTVVDYYAPIIDSRLQLSIEGVLHPLETSDNRTAPVVLGTAEDLDSGAAGIDAGNLYLEYVNTPPLDSTLDYSRIIEFIFDDGIDTPYTSPMVGIFIEDNGRDHYYEWPYIVDTFDSGDEGWVFTSILGSSSGNWVSGALNITYNNTSAYSFWKRPLSGADPDIGPLSANQLYRAIMNITSSVTSSSTAGDIPDFCVATSLQNGASELYFVSSFLSDGGSNYISPQASPRDYNIYFEATGLPTGQTSALIMQFEGFNFPFAGRVNLIGAAIGLNRAEVDANPAYAVNSTGTVIHLVNDIDGFAIGSGTANGWAFTTFTTGGNAGSVGAKAADNEGLVITGNPLGSNTYVYGSWDANPGLAASLPTFSGGVLYRATFKITTAIVASASVNQPIPKVRIQTGDSHLAVAGNLFSNFGSANNKQLTVDEATTPPIDLWFYYDGAARTGTLEPKIYPAFELLVLPDCSIPDSTALTLRSYELSEQLMPE